MNSQTYSLFAFLRPEQVYERHLGQPDAYVPTQFFVHLFFRGQFYTLYSFLFGLSFYLMWSKNNQAGLDANRIFRRRLWLLLLMGLIHAFIFWFGDILHKYALLGFTLLYFNTKSVATVLNWMVALLLLGIGSQVVTIVLFPDTPESLARSQQSFELVVTQVVSTWQYGSVWDVIRLQKLGVMLLHIAAIRNGLVNYLHYELLFLLGLVTGKLQLFRRINAIKIQLLKLVFWIFPFALLLKGLSCLPLFDIHLLPATQLPCEKLIFSLAEFMGTPLLTIVYLIELSLFLQQKPPRFFRWIGNAGRLGLTNYLMQTLLCMAFFYGYAFGFSGHLTLLQSFFAVICLYIFQVWYSTQWLKYHRSGPLETVWRNWAYKNEVIRPSASVPKPESSKAIQ
ncbi:DUF418 domain-containing protein [Larkinella rosea]|nr:DUF418 domain-containing protein [Larkinella rosea]